MYNEKTEIYYVEGSLYTYNYSVARKRKWSKLAFWSQHITGFTGEAWIFCSPKDFLFILDRWNSKQSAFKYWKSDNYY